MNWPSLIRGKILSLMKWESWSMNYWVASEAPVNALDVY